MYITVIKTTNVQIKIEDYKTVKRNFIFISNLWGKPYHPVPITSRCRKGGSSTPLPPPWGLGPMPPTICFCLGSYRHILQRNLCKLPVHTHLIFYLWRAFQPLWQGNLCIRAVQNALPRDHPRTHQYPFLSK